MEPTMELKTAEQALEEAKDLDFNKVWAALMEDRVLLRESKKEMDEFFRESKRQLDEAMRESKKQLDEAMRESKRELDETMRESNKRMDAMMDRTDKQIEKTSITVEKTSKEVAELTKNIGGVSNRLGQLTEAMFSGELWKKFNAQNYGFTRQTGTAKYTENGKVIAEVDFLFEDGRYVMPVEVKTKLDRDDVNEHIKRIGTIRRYMDAREDKRTLVGAMAGGTVDDRVLKYAQSSGLYVFVQSGDSVIIADAPPDFKAREWRAP